jgi:hypothetical protein
MHPKKDINPGDIFGKLTVTSEAERRIYPSGQYQRQFKCQCECGNTALALLPYLLSGHTTSCGCARLREYEGKTLGRYLIGARTGGRDVGGAATYKATCTECGTVREDSISTLRKAGERTCMCFKLKPGTGENRGSARARQTAAGRAAQLQSNAKRRAEDKGIPFNLDRLDLIQRITAGHCEVTGIPFDLGIGAGINPWAPSLDRKDSSKGYTFDNVQVVCTAYNLAKHQFPTDVLLRLARAIVDAASKNGV